MVQMFLVELYEDPGGGLLDMSIGKPIVRICSMAFRKALSKSFSESVRNC
jgi:hypothetical protein